MKVSTNVSSKLSRLGNQKKIGYQKKSGSQKKSGNQKYWLICFVLASLFCLSGCSDDGSDGAQGPEGPAGPPGPTPTPLPSEITASMSAELIGATIATDGTVVATFSMANDIGYPFIGLPASQIRFTLAQLFPAEARGPGESTQWQSYINKTENPPTDPANGAGTETKIQATSESNGTLLDNGDGTYTYTFATNILNVTSPLAVTYNQDYTHRVAFQISGGGFPTLNRSFDWQPSTGATTGITTREMVVEGTCNNCHGELALHGGGRVDTAYCVTCHNPGTSDANSGKTVDFKVMVHKIHRGANLPSVQAGGEYAIWGYGNSKHDYSSVHLPQDVRNCTSCHDDAITETPDAANWMNKPTMEACGSCHDDVDFALGIAGGHAGGVMTDNSDCSVCHREGGLASVREKHLGVMEQIELSRTKLTAVPQSIRIDQVSGDVEVDVLMTLDGTPVTALIDGNGVDTAQGAIIGQYRNINNGALAINWDNGDGYQLNHQEILFNDCIANGSGLFTCSKAGLLAGITDTDKVTVTTVDTLLCMNEKDGLLARCDSAETSIMRIKQLDVKPTFAFFNGDNSIATSGYDKFGADIEACKGCHKDAQFHHGATDLGQCKTCHNATRASSRGRPGDLKHHVHRFHSGLDDDILIPVEVGDSDHYPNNISDCHACHSEGQIDLPIQQNQRASIANRDAPVYISPTAVVCGSCHIDAALGYIDPGLPGYMDPANGTIPREDQAVVDHMVQNGAVFGAAAFSTANKVESCAVCHAIGAQFGVDKVHEFHEH